LLEVLQVLHEVPEAHLKLTGSNLKQSIAKLNFHEAPEAPEAPEANYFLPDVGVISAEL